MASLRSRTWVLAALTAIVGAVTACAPLPKFYVGEGADRPPIVVRSGSTTITATPDPRLNYRGFFDVESPGSRWKHQHPNAATVALEVSIEGSSIACAAVTRTTEVEVHFDIGGEHKTLTFDIDHGDLRIQSNAPFIRNLGEPYILNNESATLTSVEIEGGPACAFSSSPRTVRISQKRQ